MTEPIPAYMEKDLVETLGLVKTYVSQKRS